MPTAPVGAFERLPSDALVLLVGPAGAGKSTWAAANAPASAIVSSDHLRAVVSDDAADQAATGDAYRLLHAIVRARLRRSLLTVVDATNLTTSARTTLRRQAERAGRPVAAVVFDLPLELLVARNASRPDRQVPPAVVRRHHAQLQAAWGILPEEGYTVIVRLGEADLTRG